jgi:hypothetical protein
MQKSMAGMMYDKIQVYNKKLNENAKAHSLKNKN